MISNKYSLSLIWIPVILILSQCGNEKDSTDKNSSLLSTYTLADQLEGERLSKHYCSSCHQYVGPEKLPRAYWSNVLTKMSYFFGVNEGGTLPVSSHAQRRLDSAAIFPGKQIISDGHWQKIKQYYMSISLDSLDQGIRPPIDFEMSQFDVHPVQFKAGLFQTTYLKVMGPDRIATGLSELEGENILMMINKKGDVINRIRIPSPLTSISIFDEMAYLTFMGSFAADDNLMGSIGKLSVNQNFEKVMSVEFLKNKERPVHINTADLNNDGIEDIIVSEFGKYLGGLNIYFQSNTKGYLKRTIYNGPGTISSIIRDVDKDGLPDIYALISQAREGIHLFINKGKGNFIDSVLISFPPYYGSSCFELVDFDSDGLEDIIYSNGDSGDFGMPVKPFHGIRIFKNNNNQSYSEICFYPQPGAYKSITCDFDQDNDMDIASIGYFSLPTIPKESFLYLENLGLNEGKPDFRTFSYTGATTSSFLVMDSGDLDGDGDADLLLGGSTALMTISEIGEQLAKWDQEGGPIIFLENTLK